MEEYRSNSHKSREKRNETANDKKIEKVISSSAKTKKKSGIYKMAEVFVPDDVSDVKSYIFEGIIVPAIKDIILDTVTAVLGVNRNSNKKSQPSSRINYRKYYDDRDKRDCAGVNKTRSGYEYDDIIIENRGEAEDVLCRMDELISTYGLVSVADFYDLVGITGNYTDNKYGWTDIRTASVVRAGRDGYMIKLPKALPLN